MSPRISVATWCRSPSRIVVPAGIRPPTSWYAPFTRTCTPNDEAASGLCGDVVVRLTMTRFPASRLCRVHPPASASTVRSNSIRYPDQSAPSFARPTSPPLAVRAPSPTDQPFGTGTGTGSS